MRSETNSLTTTALSDMTHYRNDGRRGPRALASQLRSPTRNQRERGRVVRWHGIDEETAIGGNVVLSTKEVWCDDASLEKHPRCTCYFMPTIKAHGHQFPVRRYVEDLLAVPRPRGLCSSARNFETSPGTRKGLD